MTKAYGTERRHFNVARRSAAVLLPALLLLALARPALAERVIVALGDSLTAGYGLAEAESFPSRLQRALAARGLDVRIVNAGVSGDTTAGGLARLSWALPPEAEMAIVAFGGNDGLRGIDPAETRRNLDAILAALGARGLKVLLAGMLAPPNLGPEYGEAFNRLYPELAERHGVALYPFFLDGVAARPELNQHDGIHPNAAGVDVMVERMLPVVIEVLQGGT